jgi:DNA-binding transcriptional regulator YiaG
MDQQADLAAIIKVRRLCATGEAKKIRVNARVTRAEMARLAKTTGPAVTRWEECQRRPQGAHATRYYRALVRLQRLSTPAEVTS